jgi:hypothetical protein
MPRSVVRLPDGAILLRLGDNERAIVRSLVGDLRAIVGETPTPGLWEADAEEEVDDAAGAEPAGEEPAGRATQAPAEPPREADPVIARLYPDVRPDDPTWSAGFRDLVRGDLDDARREQLAVVEASIDSRTVDDEEAEAWLHVLNDVRLVLGTRLGVTEEDDESALDVEDPAAAARIVYAYAGYLEGQFVDVLAATLPDTDDGVDHEERPGTDER